MQTFMPEYTFKDSAKVLDTKRLGKQRVEAKQIYLSLTDPDYGWKHHPAVKMWAGCEGSLAMYGYAMCQEWIYRGFDDTLLPWFEDKIHDHTSWAYPVWMCDPQFHRSHRSNLMRKDPDWYSRWYAGVPDDIPYFWPTKEEKYADLIRA